MSSLLMSVGFRACLSLSCLTRFRYRSLMTAPFAQLAKVFQQSHRLVVGAGLFARDERINLFPDLGLPLGEIAQVSRPGGRLAGLPLLPQ